MDLTANHYALLLGLKAPWKVTSVDLDVEALRVDIRVVYEGESGHCPECAKVCKVYDQSPERSWRHLDTMQFGTYLHSKSPRIRCQEHGVKTMSLPWAAKHSGFTLLLEAFAIRVLQASRSTQAAGDLLCINWHPIQAIMERAVQRGLARRKPEEIAWIGMGHLSDEALSQIKTLLGRCELEVSKA